MQMQTSLETPVSIDRSSQVAPDGTVETGNLRVPFSAYASEEARKTFLSGLTPPPPEIANDVPALRQHYAAFNDRLRDLMLERFQVEIEETEIAGIPVHRVTPTFPVDESGRVLLNLHGGAFMWGSGSGALVEAIPVAATSGLPVIAVDYRLAPEHTFPAASDDVQAVYESLLTDLPASSIGIYGCSAGAILTAQCVAQFLNNKLPLPGGIAMIGGAGLLQLGDSAFTSPALSGERPNSDTTDGDMPLAALRNYLECIPLDDPRVAPGVDSEILRHFPPSLLITGSRDFAASSVTTMHRRLVAQQVHAELFTFDGLWHAFHIFPDLPESLEVYDLLAGFFNRTLTVGT
jgi:monoterpene epsilon-lactone hydrolase